MRLIAPVSRPTYSRARWLFGGALAWLALAIACTGYLLQFPAAPQGLYLLEQGSPPFHWTSNRVTIPLDGWSAPTHIVMRLRAPPQDDGTPLPLTFGVDGRLVAHGAVDVTTRRYEFFITPTATALELQSPVRRLGADDGRWMGAQLLSLVVSPAGLPLRQVILGALLGAGLLLALAGVVWLAQRGYGLVAGLTAIGLTLRLAWLSRAPPGFGRDELVSLVDAWFLVRTGRDHLGHLLPIAAFEAYGDWISPLLTYLETPLAIFGVHPLAARVLVAVIGALAIPAIYGLSRELRLPPIAAICAALVIACAPWTVFLSRAAKPPALVPLAWTICLWSAIRFLRDGGRRSALRLAAAAGIALYTYPTLKLALPMMLLLTLALALVAHGRARLRAWLPAALLLTLLWLPFGISTLFNSASSSRFDQVALQAPTPAAWAAEWWNGYRTYFQPSFYYIAGDSDSAHGIPGRGSMPLITAPLVLLGLAAVVRGALGRASRPGPDRTAALEAWFLLGCLLIAPLPASLTADNPHAFRAATVAPLYALLAGYGAATLGHVLAALHAPALRRAAQIVAISTFAVGLMWECGTWMRDLTLVYAPNVAPDHFSDGLPETVRRALQYAPAYDDVIFDIGSIAKPYIYVLAAQPFPPRAAQQALVVDRPPLGINDVQRIGPYRFLHLQQVPRDLPVLEAVPDQFGNTAFVIQAWRRTSGNSLIVRGVARPSEDLTRR